MREIISSQLFMLVLTIGCYLLGVFIYRKTKISLLHPLLTSILLIILFLKIFDIEYPEYQAGTRIIDFLLGVSVVTLGFLLYEQIEHIKGRLATIITAISVGSIVGIASVVFMARWMGAPDEVTLSLQPKSVTAPIAIAISESVGGISSLTSVVVVVVGIFGGIVGPFVMDKLGISDKIARGLAMGSASHAMGTARAIELGAVEGALSGLAIGIMGIITAILVPLIGKLI